MKKKKRISFTNTNILEEKKDSINKMCLEALSKIPKRFIDGKTDYVSFVEQGKVFMGNPKYTPIVYDYKLKKWKTIKIGRMT